MPYTGEQSNKASHSDIVQNPDVQQFLNDCTYLTEPSEDEEEAITSRFQPPPTTDGAELPLRVVAVDGSLYESSIDDRLPSTKVGFTKLGLVLIKMEEYSSLRVRNNRFVDPAICGQCIINKNGRPGTVNLSTDGPSFQADSGPERRISGARTRALSRDARAGGKVASFCAVA